MAWKAALLGIKAVKLAGRGPLAKPESARAPRAAVSSRRSRVVEIFCGMVRKLSMTWMTPPLKLIFYSRLVERGLLGSMYCTAWVTVDLPSRPEEKTTSLPEATASTR
jgi:hypothetical protein